jgi:pimeloyl-ACP methyl ester carboxylesterase
MNVGHILTTVPERKSFDFPDGRISFLEWNGSPGAPVLLFAHANGFNAFTYRSILAPLAGVFRIVAFDMRGHGLTTLPTEPQHIRGWKIYRDDLLNVLAQLRDVDVVLAGHSLGASVSLMAAAEKPRNVKAVVLAEPVLPTLATAFRALAARTLGCEEQMLPRVGPARRRRRAFASREQAVAGFRGRGAFKTWPDDQVLADYIEGGTITDGQGVRLACAPDWEAANFAVFPFGLASLAGQFAGPLTILQAEHHSSAAQSALQTLQQAKPDTRVRCVDGTTHFLPMERPEVLREEIVATAARAAVL